MKWLAASLICLAVWLAPNCASDPVVNSVKIKYPACTVLNVERAGDVVKVRLQCPTQTKTITMYDRS